MKRIIITLAALAFMAAPAKAEIVTYELDKPHTQILFFVEHMQVSISSGEFLDYEGTLNIDMAHPTNSSADITIHTASIDMGSEKWDDHMKNEDFFHVEEYPAMTFKSTGVQMTGDTTAKMTGDLTMLGVTKPVTLDVTFRGEGKHAYSGKDLIGFSATGNIKRSEWGMDYGIPNVGDDIELRIEVEAVKQDGQSEDGQSTQ